MLRLNAYALQSMATLMRRPKRSGLRGLGERWRRPSTCSRGLQLIECVDELAQAVVAHLVEAQRKALQVDGIVIVDL